MEGIVEIQGIQLEIALDQQITLPIPEVAVAATILVGIQTIRGLILQEVRTPTLDLQLQEVVVVHTRDLQAALLEVAAQDHQVQVLEVVEDNF
jgi:hypothetical protein